MMIVIVVGNMLVIIAIATENNLTTVQNWFIASLAMADMMIGLVVMPFSLRSICCAIRKNTKSLKVVSLLKIHLDRHTNGADARMGQTHLQGAPYVSDPPIQNLMFLSINS